MAEGNFLTQKIGPIPAWGWGIGAGAAVILVSQMRNKGGGGDVDLVPTTNIDDIPYTGVGLPRTDAPPPPQSNRPTTNAGWVAHATDLLIIKHPSWSPSSIQSALNKYVLGLAVNETEEAIINSALREAGVPPEPVPPMVRAVKSVIKPPVVTRPPGPSPTPRPPSRPTPSPPTSGPRWGQVHSTIPPAFSAPSVATYFTRRGLGYGTAIDNGNLMMLARIAGGGYGTSIEATDLRTILSRLNNPPKRPASRPAPTSPIVSRTVPRGSGAAVVPSRGAMSKENWTSKELGVSYGVGIYRFGRPVTAEYARGKAKESNDKLAAARRS